MAELFDHLDDLRRSARKVAVATLVNTRGTTPRKEGAKMVVGEGGAILGSVTIGGCVDAQVLEQSEDVLATMRPRLLELNLGDEEAWEAMATGVSRTLFLESTRAFVEVLAPPAQLIVVGASHVAMPLVALAKVLGYRTVVLDGRPRFATRERFPDVDELRVGIPSELVAEYPLIPSTALVLVAHDYKYDLPVLRRALAADVGYIGMLGSSRRGAAILTFLTEDGVSDAQLKRVRVPTGLDLGARSAPEIALAIMAEIQAARGGGSGQPLSARPHAPASGHPRSVPALRPPVE